jgi:hypothetical protein
MRPPPMRRPRAHLQVLSRLDARPRAHLTATCPGCHTTTPHTPVDQNSLVECPKCGASYAVDLPRKRPR